MPGDALPLHKHILAYGTASPEQYTAVGSGGSPFKLKVRQRRPHGEFLKQQLQRIKDQAEHLPHRTAVGLPSEHGLMIVFESDPDYPLKIDSLEKRRSGIELLSVRVSKVRLPNGSEVEKTLATVLVPPGKLIIFFNLVEAYSTKFSSPGKPKNKTLIESIADIRLASLEALWTDDGELPQVTQKIWWEVWLRRGANEEERAAILQQFKNECQRAEIQINRESLSFPEQTVLLVHASTNKLRDSVFLLNCMTEIRRAKETAAFFVGMPNQEQAEWVTDAVGRIEWPNENSPAVCVLDTGVNNAHPLLEPAVSASDLHAYNPAWGVNDTGNHGTRIAGLALHGDLFELLSTGGHVRLVHRLESVKILPPTQDNHPELYGSITKECVARAEVQAPHRKRSICLPVTTDDFRDRGQPSSWSAAIDQLASGADEPDPIRRLICISGGNVNRGAWPNYPNSNTTDGIHDPGQAWNAITVGAHTEKDASQPGWTCIAPKGGLSPSSTTSVPWQGLDWPLKPEVVFEGGNAERNNTTGDVDAADALSLLTTHEMPTARLLSTIGDTSAAVALAARYCAIISASYPDLWPETIRGLLVHSAKWTEQMLDGLDLRTIPKSQIETLLRTCGYGVPNLERALWSANNSLTLIAQDSLQPFNKVGSEMKTKDLNFHTLPWPTEVLEQLGEAPVIMKVTLSYFVEPSPGRKSWRNKYRYACCGLRYEVRRQTESSSEFKQRINKIARDEADDYTSTGSDSDQWILGAKLRTKGSIHCDTWSGTASELAAKGFVGVFPVNGWWRERPQLNRWSSKIRYALIVTIETPSQEVDIYTPVATLIEV